MDFKQTIKKLIRQKKIEIVRQSISLQKAAEIAKSKNTAFLFENISGFKNFKIAANICTAENLYSLYNLNRSTLRKKMLSAIENQIKPKISGENSFAELPVDLSKLPILQHYKEDGGKYITAGVFFAKSPKYGQNLSFHRALVIGKNKLAIRLCHRHLWNFYSEANKNLAVAICIGLNPAVLLAGATCTEIGVDESTIASAFDGKPIELVALENGISVPKDSEIVLIGKITNELAAEGPFVDMTGTIDFTREQPVVEIEKILCRDKKEIIYHTIIPAKDEHRFLMGFPREPVIFKAVSEFCECKDVFLTNGGVNWLHAAVSIRKKSENDAKEAIEAVFRAHPSVKHVFVFDEDIDITHSEEREWAFATRFQGDKQMHVYENYKGSSLDPSSSGNEDRRLTCKIGFDCTIPLSKDKRDFLKLA